MAGPSIIPDKILEDGDLIDCGAGVRLRTIHLPGHTLGSVGLFWEERGFLFSGDSIGGLHDGRGKIPIIFDLPSYKRSMKRIQEIPIRSILCAHDYRGICLPPASLRHGEEVVKFVHDSLEFAERLDDAIAKVSLYKSEKGFIELADEVVAQFPKEMGFKSFTKVERPFLSGQTIFFRLSQLNPHYRIDRFDKDKKA